MSNDWKLLRFPEAVQTAIATGQEHFIVTGAGGWLGRATLEMLEGALGAAFPTRVHAFARQARALEMRSGRTLALRPLAELTHLPLRSRGYYLLHYAFSTRENVESIGLGAYIDQNRVLTSFVSDQASRLLVRGCFVTSSGAVYRDDKSLETDLRTNPYGFLKLDEERVFFTLANRLGVAAQVCRIFNLSGPFLNKPYALGSMIRDVLSGRPIAIHATTPVYRSFAHVSDVISVGVGGVMQVVQSPTEPYDTAGEEVVEMQDLAESVKLALGQPGLEIHRPRLGQDRSHCYVGNGEVFAQMCKRLGRPRADLTQQIQDTADYMKEFSP